jgi:hypothetical protein
MIFARIDAFFCKYLQYSLKFITFARKLRNNEIYAKHEKRSDSIEPDIGNGRIADCIVGLFRRCEQRAAAADICIDGNCGCAVGSRDEVQ